MTDSEIDALDAGREMDARIAEYVMGLDIVHRSWPCYYAPDCGTYEASISEEYDGFNANPDAIYKKYTPSDGLSQEDRDDLGLWCAPVPFYSASIADAWRVVEIFRVGWSNHAAATIEMEVSEDGGRDCFCRIISPDMVGGMSDGNTMPEAICKAALKAVNHVSNLQTQ